MAQQDPLFTPPRFFQNVTFHRHTNRSISWLELFYDLVYVATLIQIGNYLSDNVTWLGFGQFLVMIIVVWWAWTGETFFQNRFVVDDLTHRALVFSQMFAIATLGLSVSGAFGDLYVQFTLAYVFTRLMLVFMYARGWLAHPESRELTRNYIIGFSLGIVIWLGSLLLPPEIHWVGWLVGITVELMVPLTPNMRRLQAQFATDVHHITERLGIFTIIVLGESFVKVLDDAQGISIGLPEMLFSTFGLLILYSLWWLYFTDTTDAEVEFNVEKSLKPIAWLYGHLPLAAGLVAFGVAAKKAFSSVYEHPGEPLEPKYRLLYTGAILLYLIAVALVDYATRDEDGTPHTQRAYIRLGSAVIVLVIGLAATGADAIAFVVMVAVVMVGQVIYSIYDNNKNRAEKPVDVQVAAPGQD